MMVKQRRKKPQEARRGVFFMCLMSLVAVILCVNIVSAMNFDNTKSYDSEKREVTITNSFGFGKELLKAKLSSPLIVNVIDEGVGVYQMVAEIEIINLDRGYKFKETFGEIETYNKKNMNPLSRDLKYFLKIVEGTYQSPVSETHCPTQNLDDCYTEILRYETKERIEWNLIESFKDLPEGRFTIGIFTDVQAGDYVEWIPEYFGKRVVEWAGWTTSLNNDLKAYWSLDETSGTVIIDSVNGTGTHNGTNEGAQINQAGINKTAYYFANDTSHLNMTNNLYNSSTKNLTIAFWFNNNDSWSGNDYLWKYANTVGFNIFLIFADNTDGIRFRVANDTSVTAQLNSMIIPTLNVWHFVVVQFTGDGTGQARLWLNGTLVATDNELSGMENSQAKNNAFGKNMEGNAGAPIFIDEIGWWDRYLNESEIVSLYNNGAGTGIIIDDIPPDVNLSAPSDLIDLQIINNNLTINWTVSDVHLDTCWYNFNTTNITIPCADTNTTINITDYFRSVTFYANDTFGNENSSTRAWNYSVFVWSNVFNPLTLEGSTERFELNITTNGSKIFSVELNYDNVSNSAFIVNTAGDNFTFFRTLFPSTTTDANKTFFWNITLTNGLSIKLDSNNQTVLNIGIDDCSSNPFQVYNLTLIDEEFQTLISPTAENTTIEVSLDIYDIERNSIIINFSSNFSEINPIEICLNQNVTNSTSIYVSDLVIKYSGRNYATEYHNIINATLDNQTGIQDIVLFDLLLNDSTEFQITFTGSDFLPVEDALIFIKRQYISENTFKTVEVPKTDSSGQTLAHLVRNDVVYNIDVIKDGVIVGTFPNIIAFCDDFSIGDCKINLDASSSGEAVFDYNNEVGLIFSGPTFDNATRTISFNFLTSDGSVKNVVMNTTRNDILGNISVCDTSVVSSGATLTCTVPDYISDTTIITRIFVDGVEVIVKYIPLDQNNYGIGGYYIFFVFMLAFILMFNKSEELMMFGILLGFLTGISLGLINGTMIGVGASGIWLMVVIILMIWKKNKGRVD